MSVSSEKGRRLKAFRLSDVPPEVRMRAAQVCATHEARYATDPIAAVFETLKLEAIARDPELAAETMKADCENGLHIVTLEEWERATNPRRRW